MNTSTDKERESYRKYHQQHREERNAKSRKYHQEHKDEINRRHRQDQQERKQKFLEWKKQFQCEKCGESHPVCLDFHHINGADKIVSVGKMKSNSEEKIKEELKKCVVLCANCHRKLHFAPVERT